MLICMYALLLVCGGSHILHISKYRGTLHLQTSKYIYPLVYGPVFHCKSLYFLLNKVGMQCAGKYAMYIKFMWKYVKHTLHVFCAYKTHCLALTSFIWLMLLSHLPHIRLTLCDRR